MRRDVQLGRQPLRCILRIEQRVRDHPVHELGRQDTAVRTVDSNRLDWGFRADIYPLQMLLLTVSGWAHRHQADVIAYLVEANRVLKEQMKGRALRFTEAHVELAHQGIGNERIEQRSVEGEGPGVCDEHLGGLLECYRRAA